MPNAPDSLTLPCGLVLKRNAAGDAWELPADKRFCIDYVAPTWGIGAPSIALFPFDTQEEAVAALEREIQKLRTALAAPLLTSAAEALEPFAKISADIGPDPFDSQPFTEAWLRPSGPRLSIGDFRRAAEVVARIKENA